MKKKLLIGFIVILIVLTCAVVLFYHKSAESYDSEPEVEEEMPATDEPAEEDTPEVTSEAASSVESDNQPQESTQPGETKMTTTNVRDTENFYGIIDLLQISGELVKELQRN